MGKKAAKANEPILFPDQAPARKEPAPDDVKAADVQRMDTEIDRLAEQIRYHNSKYWVEHQPEISDQEYDRLVERLRALDPDNPALVELVEDTGPAFPKVNHAEPMLSIEKKFTAEDVVRWATEAGAFRGTEPEDGLAACYKVDGSSCSLIYEDGRLVRAASRGNGWVGDDITRNARTIQDLPQRLEVPAGSRFDVRGEIYMSLEAFRRALAQFEERLAAGEAREEDRPTNPRNFCAGSLKQKDPRITRQRQLSFMAHGCVGAVPNTDNKSEVARLRALEQLGFKTPFCAQVRQPEEIATVIAAIDRQRRGLPYETDGVVFTINRVRLHPEMGNTSHHPRYRLAYKFSRERGATTIQRIIWHTTRSGRVSPTMEVTPVSLGGATVTLCTLHNARTIRETGVKPGDEVLLEREVIPYFVEKLKDGPGEVHLPAECESCRGKLQWDETSTNLVCPNLGGCPSQLHDYLSYYVSRGVTNMMGVGEKLISKLLAAKLLSSPADFYPLTEQQIRAHIERQGEISTRNIIAAIQSRREQPLDTFLVSLGIRGLGRAVAQRLVEHFSTLQALQSASEAQLMEVEGIAETMAATLRQGLQERKPLIHALLKHVALKEPEKIEGALSGQSFCLTGHVEFDFAGRHYEARPEIEELIRSRGGSIKNVSRGLNYLVVGRDPGSKVEKARKAGVAVIDAARLLQVLKGKE